MLRRNPLTQFCLLGLLVAYGSPSFGQENGPEISSRRSNRAVQVSQPAQSESVQAASLISQIEPVLQSQPAVNAPMAASPADVGSLIKQGSEIVPQEPPVDLMQRTSSRIRRDAATTLPTASVSTSTQQEVAPPVAREARVATAPALSPKLSPLAVPPTATKAPAVTKNRSQQPLPKLADPDMFRVSRSPSGLSLAQEAQQEAAKRGAAAQARSMPRGSLSDEAVGSEDELFASLPRTNLADGISGYSFQRAVGNSGGIPDLDATRLNGAQYAMDYRVNAQPVVKTWNSPDMAYRPLYFEDENLERYGNSVGKLQPFVSGAKFFTTTAFLPYKLGQKSPTECETGMGYFRPGDCNAAFRKPIQPSRKGALYQALAVGAIVGGL